MPSNIVVSRAYEHFKNTIYHIIKINHILCTLKRPIKVFKMIHFLKQKTLMQATSLFRYNFLLSFWTKRNDPNAVDNWFNLNHKLIELLWIVIILKQFFYILQDLHKKLKKSFDLVSLIEYVVCQEECNSNIIMNILKMFYHAERKDVKLVAIRFV